MFSNQNTVTNSNVLAESLSKPIYSKTWYMDIKYIIIELHSTFFIIKNNLVIKGRNAFFVPNIIENGEGDSQKQVKLFFVMK